MVEIIEKEREKIELNANFRKRMSHATGFLGRLRGDFVKASNDENFILAEYIRELIQAYQDFEKTGIVQVPQWKGKSSLKLIHEPDKIIAIKWQKWAKGEEAKQVKFEFTKKEVNMMISAVNNSRLGDWVESKEIFGNYLKLAGIGQSKAGRPLFIDGGFIFDNLFCWRKMHNKLVLLLDILDAEKRIEYKGGRVKVIK